MPRRYPPLVTRARVRAVTVLALLSVTATACGDAGELRGAGPTTTAAGPARLWPELPPASSPAFEIGEVDIQVVKGVEVPGDDIRTADPVAVVRAEIARNPGDYEGSKAAYRETNNRMAECGRPGDRTRCPVLEPYYGDLTGDGRPEMTLGFRLLPGEMTAVRVYTVDKHRLVQVMAYDDALTGIEIAGQSVILRAPSEVQGYEYRLQWSWDTEQRAMLLTHDEMLRTGKRPDTHRPSRTPSPSPR
ncbi:lipoprotein [Streptomyces spinoverrucosus]|uniref:Lipoprotein n=1 Tax=Streptomyces spinoverrucosus TaxID=284043 RepID=A0A4Y3VW14_9ACTN|nr:hypothetical protein [Streptomyces spinoverrucosus]GEC09951.1 lipoprotein [Streptomyces spinoverrucosus]GHB68578.1 lipoprotein [Streptomyces spinoverrucosus]